MSKNICNNCGSTKSTEFLTFDKPSSQIVTCEECGLKYLTPQPKQSDRENIYNEFYFKREAAKNKNVSGYRSYHDDQFIHNFYFSKLLEKIKGNLKGKSIFEIGSAMGFFLDNASKAGFVAEGIEISDYCVKFGKDKLKLNIQKSDFKDYNPGKKFHAVALFQTIEHLPDPKFTVKKISKILKDDGVIIITTPNQKSFVSKLFGKKWFEYKPTEHFFYYDPKTIFDLLTKADFKNIRVLRDLHYLSVEYILERIRYYIPIISVIIKPVEKIALTFKLNKKLIPFDKGSMLIIASKSNEK